MITLKQFLGEDNQPDNIKWFDMRGMSDKHMQELDNMTHGPDGPGHHLHYGENYGHPEFVIGVNNKLPNWQRTEAHLTKHAKAWKKS